VHVGDAEPLERRTNLRNLVERTEPLPPKVFRTE
jgi:hypothetical protein